MRGSVALSLLLTIDSVCIDMYLCLGRYVHTWKCILLSFLQKSHNRGGAQVVDVVLDPRLSYQLRPHQREGVLFLYECVMGLREFNGQGAILA